MSSLQQSPLHIALFGAGGYMGKFYIKALLEKNFPPTQLLLIEPNTRAWGEIYHIFSTQNIPETDFNLMNTANLQNAGMNTAIICANSTQHAGIIQTCYNAGITHVLSEKPLVHDVSEIPSIRHCRFENFYVAHLINASGVVKQLMQFMEDKNVFATEIHSVWGKNWLACDRPMGGDLEEEVPHPLALAITLINVNQAIRSSKLSTRRLSQQPHMQPEIAKQATRLGFDTQLNNSSLLAIEFETTNRTVVPFFSLSSFTMPTQTRRVTLLLQGTDDTVARYLVELNFDLKSVGDTCVITNAATNEPVKQFTATNNKLADCMLAALNAFQTGTPDNSLVTWADAIHIIQLLQAQIITN